ncbi:hypothetical protein CAEBREN_03567 [Caenorhabditis brenneri]|uniref:JmjC domain-containing protein n=1 Tax=Caenorhabditis brenneri TaxID=135651 RepID=G0P4M3_CAEBE|nr:hypothetical protein CAEBREN_03567 [Caenorhabditis brenneri]
MGDNGGKPPNINASPRALFSNYGNQPNNQVDHPQPDSIDSQSNSQATSSSHSQSATKSTLPDVKQEIKEEVTTENQLDDDFKHDFKMNEKSPIAPQAMQSNADSDAESDEEETLHNTSGDGRCKVCGKTDEETKAEAAKNQEQSKLYMSKKKSHLVKEPEYKWIACDHCRGWFHFSCAKLEQYEWNLYKIYYCKDCSPVTGPSILFEKFSPHRYRWFSPKEKELPMEVGSESWIEKFRTTEHEIPPPDESEVCIVEDGEEFQKKFRELGGPQKWEKVFLVRKPNGLGMTMPQSDFDIEDVVRIMGPEYEVDTIDVFNQTTYSMKLSTFQQKFRSKEQRYLLYNFLSLEFSENEEMRKLAEPPQFVKDISLVNKLWPDTNSDEYAALLAKDRYLAEEIKPKVEQFCLAGMAKSYTDFHVDFGGSSVYYHIFKGQKIFYIAPPTEENLREYQQHEISHKSSDWFGDKIKGRVKRVVISQGETLLIPAGWIHAVLTPADSLVFGGNFLHMGNIEMQMRIYELEMAVRKAINSAAKFYFPNFEFLHWMLLKNYITPKIRKSVEEGSDMREIDNDLWTATLFLVSKLEEWFNRELSGGVDENEKQETEVFIEEKKKLLNVIRKLIGSQNSKFHSNPRVKHTKSHRRSREAEEDDDDDYVPSSSKKNSKTPKREKNVIVPKKKKRAENHIEEIPIAKSTSVESAPLKLMLTIGPTEDQSNVMQMFKNQCTSSGRHVKLNKSVVELGGSNLESRLEEIPEKPTTSFHDLDKELIRCEAIHSGEKPPKFETAKTPKPPKEPKEKKERPAKKKEDARSRLMKKLHMK